MILVYPVKENVQSVMMMVLPNISLPLLKLFKYFEVLDLLTEEISSRFDQQSLALPIAVEELLMSALNSSKVVIPNIVSEAYSNDICITKIERQLAMLPDLLSAYKLSQNLKVLNVTSVRTLCEMLLTTPLARDMFSEIDKLLRIYLTIPISTATSERSFSALRRIKTYLRSTMTEQRLNNVMICHVHKDTTSGLDLVEIADM